MYKESKYKYYTNNKEKVHATNARVKAEKSQYIREFKNKPCMDCGIAYPYFVMDLHHRDAETKSFQPHRLAHSCSWTKLKEELNKCDVLCANCHRYRTFKPS